MLFDLSKISSRLEPESKFMFFRVCYSRFVTETGTRNYHIFPRNFVKICSILKPEIENKLTN